ncbi:MAG TPA: cytochrome c-type biogenesis protein CcmH [Gemmatimonadaceae bacterium]|nr:cytochrome c-type biogenesis protein CcmH [Gemmatimonadaceae bacterium]
MTSSRRDFLRFAALGAAATFVQPRREASAQAQTFSGPMEQSAHRPVVLPAKPGAKPSMTSAKRDDLEHQIKCQCGCVLDIYTCRTTDFSCGVSPAMHSDVMGLVDGGYDGPEILKAFLGVYGESVLMAPLKSGFNLLGYTMPFIALAGGSVLVAALIRRWKRPATQTVFAAATPIDATREELAQLDAAVRAER